MLDERIIMKLNDYFDSKEFVCKCGCLMDGIDPELLYVLTDIRKWFNKGVLIISGCRCLSYNVSIGGSHTSQHLFGKAADFKVLGIDQDKVADYLECKYPNKYGIGRYKGRTHLDVRATKARWDKR